MQVVGVTSLLHSYFKNKPPSSNKELRPYRFVEIPPETEKENGGEGSRYFFRKFGPEDMGNLRAGNSPGNHNHSEKDMEDVDCLEQDAYHKGFSKGEKDGTDAAREKFQPVLTTLKDTVLKLDEVTQSIRLNTEMESVNLAFAIAEKIVQQEITINKEVVLNIVKAALKKVIDHKWIKIRLSPIDIQLIKNMKMDLTDLQDSFKSLSFEEDASITNGGCIVETGIGDVDARIEKQLAAVKEAFDSEMKKLRRMD